MHGNVLYVNVVVVWFWCLRDTKNRSQRGVCSSVWTTRSPVIVCQLSVRWDGQNVWVLWAPNRPIGSRLDGLARLPYYFAHITHQLNPTWILWRCVTQTHAHCSLYNTTQAPPGAPCSPKINYARKFKFLVRVQRFLARAFAGPTHNQSYIYILYRLLTHRIHTHSI